ncbi:MAG: hypothetical protein GY940_09225 [bacterium]|nr:hypothetical protein [bacterium]
MNDKRRKMKRYLYIFIPLFIISVVVYSFYIANLERFMGEQDTVVFGQTRFAPGSLASLRVVTLDHKSRTPMRISK